MIKWSARVRGNQKELLFHVRSVSVHFYGLDLAQFLQTVLEKAVQTSQTVLGDISEGSCLVVPQHLQLPPPRQELQHVLLARSCAFVLTLS